MHISPIFVVAAVFLMAVIAVVAKLLQSKASCQTDIGKHDAYYIKASLFTPAERSFFGVLESLNYEGVTVCCKVRLADFVGIKKGLERSVRQRALNKVTGKHVDFLLVQKSDGKPLIAIELDDSSHEEEDRIARDSFVDGVFAGAGLPVLHVPVKPAYDPKEVHAQIDNALSRKG
jgi:hypothetical protein